MVRVAAWRVLTCGSTRWGCWSRCPARGFQQCLPRLAPRLHLGTACCTAGSGPGPPAVQTIILHSSTCPSTAARAAASCSPSNVMLSKRVLESWKLVTLHPGWRRVTAAAEMWARSQSRSRHTQGATEGLPAIDQSSPRPKAIHAGLFLQRAAHDRPLVASEACGKVRPRAVIAGSSGVAACSAARTFRAPVPLSERH